AISLPRGVGTCHREKSEGRAFDEDECELVHGTTRFCVSFMKTLAQQLHLQIVPSLLARLSSQPVGQKKTSKQCSENCQSNNQYDSDNIILRHKRKPIHQIFTASKRRCAGTAGPDRVCNARGRGRRTSNGGNGLGLRGLANSQPSTRHHGRGRPAARQWVWLVKPPKRREKKKRRTDRTFPSSLLPPATSLGSTSFN